VWAKSFLRRLADLPLATELYRSGPVEQLVALDAANGTAYVATLTSHLLHGGDARSVAADLHIHPNTYRYRMRRINELVRLDLDDIDTHAAISVQLALLDVARGPGRST
jgi:DNA-binding PucR family transcriptional regulator